MQGKGSKHWELKLRARDISRAAFEQDPQSAQPCFFRLLTNDWKLSQ